MLCLGPSLSLAGGTHLWGVKRLLRNNPHFWGKFITFNNYKATLSDVAKENSVIVLNGILESKNKEYLDKDHDKFFEFFVAQQILKEYNLGDDEVESGLVGKSGDGGIDGFYLLVDDEFVYEDMPDTDFKKSKSVIDLIIIQAKTSAGFAESVIERFITASMDIFNLSDSTLPTDAYHVDLRNMIQRFQKIYNQLIQYHAELNVSFYYASKGSQPTVNAKLKVRKLEEIVSKRLPNMNFNFEFLGANGLYKLTMTPPPLSLTLKMAEMPITTNRGGYICLVNLRDFFKFVTDRRRSLSTQLFESNVRDYQGSTKVNDAIQNSLNNHKEDFWWLNNGISIVASDVTQSHKSLTIHDPQIVNGLQTTREIYNYCVHHNIDNDDRCILVRVLTPEENSRNLIIRATNSQNVIPPAYLRSMEDIHLKIESHLSQKRLYYDRRKSYYRNQNQPRNRIVSISKLAQAVMAIVLRKPNIARARPSSILQQDESYDQIFNDSYPLDLYYVCAEGLLKIESYLRSPRLNKISKKDLLNLKFYVVMHAISGIGNNLPKPETIAKFDLSALDVHTVEDSLNFILPKYKRLGGDEKVAKGPQLVKDLLNT